MGSGSPRRRAKLVLGDVIRMRLGDIVPADARLLNGDPEEVDQSALTGESLPAEPKSGDAGIRQSRILSPHGSRGGAGTGSSHTLS